MAIEIVLQGSGANGSATSLDSAVFIKRFERRRDLETAMSSLTEMSKKYKEIELYRQGKLRKRPKLELNDVLRYGFALEEFKRAMQRHWFARQYPNVLPTLETAYATVLEYASGRNGYDTTSKPENITQILEWLRT